MVRVRAGEWSEYDLVEYLKGLGQPVKVALDAIEFWIKEGKIEQRAGGLTVVGGAPKGQVRVEQEYRVDMPRKIMRATEIYDAIRREVGDMPIEQARAMLWMMRGQGQAERVGVGRWRVSDQLSFTRTRYKDVPSTHKRRVVYANDADAVQDLPMPKHVEAIILWYAGIKKDGETKGGPMDEFVVHARVPEDMSPDEIEAYMKNLMENALADANYPSIDELMGNEKGWTFDASFERMAVERPDPSDWKADGEYSRVREGQPTSMKASGQLHLPRRRWARDTNILDIVESERRKRVTH